MAFSYIESVNRQNIENVITSKKDDTANSNESQNTKIKHIAGIILISLAGVLFAVSSGILYDFVAIPIAAKAILVNTLAAASIVCNVIGTILYNRNTTKIANEEKNETKESKTLDSETKSVEGEGSGSDEEDVSIEGMPASPMTVAVAKHHKDLATDILALKTDPLKFGEFLQKFGLDAISTAEGEEKEILKTACIEYSVKTESFDTDNNKAKEILGVTFEDLIGGVLKDVNVEESFKSFIERNGIDSLNNPNIRVVAQKLLASELEGFESFEAIIDQYGKEIFEHEIVQAAQLRKQVFAYLKDNYEAVLSNDDNDTYKLMIKYHLIPEEVQQVFDATKLKSQNEQAAFERKITESQEGRQKVKGEIEEKKMQIEAARNNVAKLKKTYEDALKPLTQSVGNLMKQNALPQSKAEEGSDFGEEIGSPYVTRGTPQSGNATDVNVITKTFQDYTRALKALGDDEQVLRDLENALLDEEKIPLEAKQTLDVNQASILAECKRKLEDFSENK